MKVSVIINPKSGSQWIHQKRKEEITRLLAQFPDVEYIITETEGPGHATILAEESARRDDYICFSFGGDGTMNEVGCGLIGSKTSLGILPAGSGNGLALHLKIPMQLDKALSQLLQGQNHNFDYGTINNIPFFLAAGVGFEGVVAARFANKKKRGFLSYFISLIEAYQNWTPIKYSARYEREIVTGKAFTIDFANGSQYGNNAIISPGASVDDGLLQFVRVLPFPHHAAPEMLLKLMSGRINRTSYHIERAFSRLELSIQDRDSIAGHVDGEPIQFQLPLNVTIHPGAMKIRLPVSPV